MAFEAVDACFGTPHISSDDLAALNTATVGKADCVLHYGDDFRAVMSSANECLIGTGVGMVGGRRFWNQAATSLTIQSGTQGRKRNDLIVARYENTSAGIESITPVVIKGTPTTGTAADPEVTANDLKLWRVPLDGINAGTPVRLFDPVASLATLGDSVSPKLLATTKGTASAAIDVSGASLLVVLAKNNYVGITTAIVPVAALSSNVDTVHLAGGYRASGLNSNYDCRVSLTTFAGRDAYTNGTNRASETIWTVYGLL